MLFNEKEELKLMKATAKGDAKAFRQLALSYEKPLHGFCSKFMRGHESFTEDVVQQVLITWWQKAPMWNPLKGSVRAWVFTMAANKCKDYLKRPHVFTDELNEETAPAITSASDDKIYKKQQADYILEAMNTLSEKQKQVVWLVYFGEMKQADVAEKLNISLKNVESILFRSKSKMKGYLDPMKGDLL